MKRFIVPIIQYIIILVVLSLLFSYLFELVAYAENQITKYTKIVTVPKLYPTSDKILGSVDNCIEEIATKLDITIPKERPIVIINVLPNLLYVQTVCNMGNDVLACTYFPSKEVYIPAPFIYLSHDKYNNETLVHELIHILMYYFNPTCDTLTHEQMAYGLEKELCK
jgi:hypothetical protein